ncbi:phosphotransferase [Streptococcus ruminantium]|nr:phosphotransferase [Streptococcus ruminantium]
MINILKKKVLSHIDAVPDNFLIYTENDEEVIRLIDWEYAGMQDPHVDIAMFCIYALYDRAQIDQLIDIYFEDACPKEIRLKIYCYIAVCGLLWSNWCEYKRSLGVDFGEYAYRQYQYARDFSSILTNR